MTVAAVILATGTESALADADGLPAVRRLADAAWSGGAVPIVVVAADPDGSVAASLAGAPVTLARPAPPEGGPVAQIVRGIEVATAEIGETDAALIWPARMTWAGPETATSLIEAHGADPASVLRPTYWAEAGWPSLVPLALLDRLRALDPALMPGDLLAELERLGAPTRRIELGDPGTVMDRTTSRAELPAYEGPSRPMSDHVHEWGAAVADTPEDAPLPGPTIVS